MADVRQRGELAAFLRARRESTDPVALGLNPGPRRRTPGLRREELAQLSGVSVTWYTWLEQARDITVSREVVGSLARVLRLDGTERAHLFTLAGLAVPAEPGWPAPVDGTVLRLLTTLLPNPAYVVNPWWDILACNAAYSGMLGGTDAIAAAERNTLWLMFTHEYTARLHVDWAREARLLAGQFRAHLARYPDDPRGHELLTALREVGPLFTDIWDEHGVRTFESHRKRFRHPVAGPLELDLVKLATPQDGQHVVIFLPADEDTAARLPTLS